MSASMRVNKYFPAHYSEARENFLDAALAAHARIESFRNTSAEQGDQQLFTDVACLGSQNADNLLVLMSGTHGIEGFGGSGVQVGLLREDVAGQLDANTGLVMIHALNPYGFANLRRFNEDNVDLNRNFIDHSGTYPVNQAYAQLAGAIAPRFFSAFANSIAMLRILWYRLLHGSARLQYAVTHGQYTHPQGLFYGGRFATWSNRILHDIAAGYLAQASRVVVVDLHTGLGPFGHGELIINDGENDPAYQRAVTWWGEDRVKSSLQGESVSALLAGTVKLAFSRMLPGAEVTAVGLEFGTLPPMAVFKAVRAENWLHHHGGPNHPDFLKIKQRLLQAFYPDDDLWKESVWEQARLVVKQALDNLQDKESQV